MVARVALLQASQDLHGVWHGRFPHQHLLEAALKGGIPLHMLPVLVQGGGPNQAQLAAGQHGLEQVGGVHGALCLAGAQHQVHLINEKNDLQGARREGGRETREGEGSEGAGRRASR
jgi:hypothetical protein